MGSVWIESTVTDDRFLGHRFWLRCFDKTGCFVGLDLNCVPAKTLSATKLNLTTEGKNLSIDTAILEDLDVKVDSTSLVYAVHRQQWLPATSAA